MPPANMIPTQVSLAMAQFLAANMTTTEVSVTSPITSCKCDTQVIYNIVSSQQISNFLRQGFAS